MTLEKAIEILDNFLIHPWTKGENELEDAAKLGIEALKDMQGRRKSLSWDGHYLLPGETKE